MLKKLLTVRELAEASGYSLAQIHNQVNNGNIRPAFKSKAVTLIGRAEFDRVMELTRFGKYRGFKRIRKNKIAE